MCAYRANTKKNTEMRLYKSPNKTLFQYHNGVPLVSVTIKPRSPLRYVSGHRFENNGAERFVFQKPNTLTVIAFTQPDIAIVHGTLPPNAHVLPACYLSMALYAISFLFCVITSGATPPLLQTTTPHIIEAETL